MRRAHWVVLDIFPTLQWWVWFFSWKELKIISEASPIWMQGFPGSMWQCQRVISAQSLSFITRYSVFVSLVTHSGACIAGAVIMLVSKVKPLKFSKSFYRDGSQELSQVLLDWLTNSFIHSFIISPSCILSTLPLFISPLLICLFLMCLCFPLSLCLCLFLSFVQQQFIAFCSIWGTVLSAGFHEKTKKVMFLPSGNLVSISKFFAVDLC